MNFNFEKSLTESTWSELKFLDTREEAVFYNYLQRFSPFVLDKTIKNILEIGCGQSTILWSLLAKKLNWKVYCIDMNPEAVAKKVLNNKLRKEMFSNVKFIRGYSIPASLIKRFYKREKNIICGIKKDIIIKSLRPFINTSLDNRKTNKVKHALNLKRFNPKNVIQSLQKKGLFFKPLLNIYRSLNDEFSIKKVYDINRIEPADSTSKLKELMEKTQFDLVFLDSGEFSSLPEFEIIDKKIKSGAYLILHDILFPKSIKNWIVASIIKNKKNYKVLLIDKSTPQGLLIAKKESD